MVGLMNYPSASKALVLGDEFTYLGHSSRRSPSMEAEVSAETPQEGSEEKKGEQGDVAKLCDAVSQLNLSEEGTNRPSMEAMFQEIRSPPYSLRHAPLPYGEFGVVFGVYAGVVTGF